MMLFPKKICVVGLGYVGLPLAVEFSKHRSVVGFDRSSKRIKELKNGQDTTKEVDIAHLQRSGNLELTANPDDIASAKIFIITVPTPVTEQNLPDFTALKEACRHVGAHLKPDDIVIFESTVYPGATEEICVPILEEVSGISSDASQDTYTSKFSFAYSPERINPGDKNHRLTNISKLVGASTKEALEEVSSLYAEIVKADIVKVSSVKVAEAAKVIENTQRDLNIAFFNELSKIFNLMDIDTEEVISAASTKWNFIPFKPGLVGGHCIGVDPYYLTFKARILGYEPEVILSGRRINDGMAAYTAKLIISQMLSSGMDPASSTIGVMGVTFKEDCPDFRNSKVFNLISEFLNSGASVRVWDPIVDSADVMSVHGIAVSSNSFDCLVDVLVLAVPHAQFADFNSDELLSFCSKKKKPFIADLKSLYNKKNLHDAGFDVLRL